MHLCAAREAEKNGWESIAIEAGYACHIVTGAVMIARGCRRQAALSKHPRPIHGFGPKRGILHGLSHVAAMCR
jgi:hypothetical protein